MNLNLTIDAAMMERHVQDSYAFNLLKNSILKDRISHGFVIQGPQDSGKYLLASLFSQTLFCERENRPCNQCAACSKVKNQNHPDVIEIEPQGSTIKIDQIRNLISSSGLSAYEGGYIVVIIKDADKMGIEAQNALLKTLEEPRSRVIFFLLTREKEMLLKTILSRCQLIHMPSLRDEDILRALKNTGHSEETVEKAISLAQGNIGKAIKYLSESSYMAMRKDIVTGFFGIKSYEAILEFSSKYGAGAEKTDRFLDMLEEVLRVFLMVSLDLYPLRLIDDCSDIWKDRLYNRKSIYFLIEFHDKLLQARKEKDSQVNWKIILERLLIYMLEENNRWKQS